MAKRLKLQNIKERYFCSADFTLRQTLSLEGTELHHLANVMRASVGDLVAVINGKGFLAQAKILTLEKRKSLLEILAVEHQAKAPYECVLAQALPRINRLDFIVEKGTELGMTQLWLFPGENSERKELSLAQLERVENICIAAMKQCGRLYLPQIVQLPKISHWQKLLMPLYFGDVHSDAPTFQAELHRAKAPAGVFCTGPESGFTAEEESFLRTLGGKGVKLHSNILRTETASLAALTLMSHHLLLK